MLKRSYYFLLCIFALSGCTSGNEPRSQQALSATTLSIANHIKVLSYNIHHANPPSKPDTIDLEAVARVILQASPDVVALQEIDVHTGRSGPYNQAKELARRTGMHAFFAKTIDYDGGSYGIAILSRYPLQNTQQHALPSNPDTGGEPRVLATADIQLPSQPIITIACTHLDAQKNPENRLMQIQKINALVQEIKHPLIIAGDFNAVADSEVIRLVDENFTRSCDPCEPTIPADHPTKAIDFIAYRPKDSFKVQKHQVLQEPYASDHAPVEAVLWFVAP